ncbi:MAG: YbaK/EbsC family protein [Phycisphaerales bacterium]
MPVKRLREYLDSHEVRYVVLSHSPAYTAQEIARAAHIPGQEMAKTVMVRLDDELVMIVMPAPAKIRFDFLRRASGAVQVELAREKDFAGLFPGCELGAMPPFGNLYEVPVIVDEALAEDEDIFFNAGTHTELIRMKYADFEALVKPTVMRTTERVMM